jgi:hypothetical protein
MITTAGRPQMFWVDWTVIEHEKAISADTFTFFPLTDKLVPVGSDRKVGEMYRNFCKNPVDFVKSKN